MASETSIGRNFGSPRARAVAAIASMVILLSSGPTAMNASMAGSRASSAIWPVPNCVTATLSGSTPDSFRITRSSVTLAWVRPMTPTRWPARSSIALIFGAGGFLEPLARQAGRRPQHHDVLAQDGDRLGIRRHVEVAARHREIGLAGSQQRDAFGRAFGRDRRQPDRTALAGKGLRQRLDQFLVVAAGRSDGNPQGDRPQRRIQTPPAAANISSPAASTSSAEILLCGAWRRRGVEVRRGHCPVRYRKNPLRVRLQRKRAAWLRFRAPGRRGQRAVIARSEATNNPVLARAALDCFAWLAMTC